MVNSADVLVIGAGPAGTATAIWLACAGWNAVLVEQHSYPRGKVCGECIAAGSFDLLDDLGVGNEFRTMAGPQLRRLAWMRGEDTIIADLPPCREGASSFGHALGRDLLDDALLRHARTLGVEVLQPARVRAVRGEVGRFECDIESDADCLASAHSGSRTVQKLRARVVVDAHGSWDPGLKLECDGEMDRRRSPRRQADLFAFKAVFRSAKLARGLLPVIAFDGGYGGMVLADGGRTTLACCIRRDALRACRAAQPDATAGEAVEAYLRRSCHGIREVLSDALRDGSWLSVGPIQPGIRINTSNTVFRVGNAAGEVHPLIGEGISMAFQSAALLTDILTKQSVTAIDSRLAREMQRRYVIAWREHFVPRLRFAALYAHAAMRPSLAWSAHALLRRWPSLLTRAAQLAGKGRRGVRRSRLSGRSYGYT